MFFMSTSAEKLPQSMWHLLSSYLTNTVGFDNVFIQFLKLEMIYFFILVEFDRCFVTIFTIAFLFSVI